MNPPVVARRRRMHRLYQRAGRRFRSRRMHAFAESMTPTTDSSVLDVGGTPDNWSLVEPCPRVTLVNLSAGDVVADGRMLPFRDNSFDVAFSNSTIEHVGGPPDQQAFAREIGRVARAYFVQTPNRYFPIEPHYLTPFVQFVPRRLFRRMARNLTIWGLIVRPSPDVIDATVRSIDLLSATRLRAMFPDADLRRERWAGLTKSLIAIRRGEDDEAARPRVPVSS